MRYKKKTNLSLSRPKWRKRKVLILKDTRETVLNPGQLTRFPTPRDDIPGDVHCAEQRIIPDIQSAFEPESKREGNEGYQRYHHITLIVTVEQENAIVDLFKQRNWVYVKAGQEQTNDDLREMCEKMSGVSNDTHASDLASVSQIETNSQQQNNRHGISGNTDGLSNFDTLTENSIEVPMTKEGNYIKVKKERDITNDESYINEKLNEVTDAHSESSVVSSSSQIATGISRVTASYVGGKVVKDSDYPTLVSFLAKPNMAEQNILFSPHRARQAKPKTVSATSGIVGSGTNQLGIRCEVCETFFSNQKYFENHVINGQCKWVCKFCEKAFVYSNYKASNKSYLYSLFKEKLDQHKKECDCTCKLCGYSCLERSRLARHMESRHSQQYACDVCFITFKSEVNLYTHKIRKHTSKTGMYRCPLCPKEYQMLASVSAHLRFSHLGHKKREMACSVCGKIFDYTTIKRHEDTHKTKDLKCDKCPAVFNSDENLKQHQRRHDKDYSHYCETCGKGFYTITDLENHRRIHTGEKPFSCSLCQYSCNVKVNLDKHMKIHEKRSSNYQQ